MSLLHNEALALKTQINYSLFILRTYLRVCTQIDDGGIWLKIIINYPSGMRLG